ncbi:MAG: hypothetical protein IS860_08660 [Nitrosopumilus sp.]|nr:hypothetical protein [Nitrosopumilus sp.]
MRDTQICSECRKLTTNEQIEKIRSLKHQNQKNLVQKKKTIKQKSSRQKKSNQLHSNFSREKIDNKYEISDNLEKVEKSLQELKSKIEFEIKDYSDSLNKFKQSDSYLELLSIQDIEKIKKLI